MVRFATFVALAVLLQGCRSRKEEIIHEPITIAPTRCNEEEPRVEITEIRRHHVGKPSPDPSWEYLLDLKVHVRNEGRLWLLVNERSFPKHVHEVYRRDVAWNEVNGAFPTEVYMPPRQPDPQVDWVFDGDGYYVKARLLAQAGDVTVRYVRTSSHRSRIPVVLATIDVDNMHPPDWVAQGREDDHRSMWDDTTVSASADVDCVDWLEIEPPERDRQGLDD